MPPRLINDAGTHEVIRPLCYNREEDLRALSEFHQYEIMPCNLCGSQQTKRQYIKGLLKELSQKQRHLKGNLLNAIGNIHPSHMMDPKLNPLYNSSSPVTKESEDVTSENDWAVTSSPALSSISNEGSVRLPILNS